jgi:hypothetical protein
MMLPNKALPALDRLPQDESFPRVAHFANLPVLQLSDSRTDRDIHPRAHLCRPSLSKSRSESKENSPVRCCQKKNRHRAIQRSEDGYPRCPCCLFTVMLQSNRIDLQPNSFHFHVAQFAVQMFIKVQPNSTSVS